MEKVSLQIGMSNTLSGGQHIDRTRPVEFIGEKLASRREYGMHKEHPTDTRGVDETLYRTEDGRLVVYVEEWSRWIGEPNYYRLHQVTPADLDVDGEFEALGREAGMARVLTLDDVVGEETPAAPPIVDYPVPGVGVALGYLRLDRRGDLSQGEMTCRTCGQVCDAGAWLTAIANGKGGVYWGGPLCELCATSE